VFFSGLSHYGKLFLFETKCPFIGFIFKIKEIHLAPNKAFGSGKSGARYSKDKKTEG